MKNQKNINSNEIVTNDGEIYAKMELITPERAAELLKNNNFNRPLKQRTVKAYVNEIKKGHWGKTAQTASISKEGILMDGQHRMQAIVETGVSLPILMAYNCDKDTFKYYDKLTPRSHADALSVIGATNVKFIAAAINFYRLLFSSKTTAVFRNGTQVMDKIIRERSNSLAIDKKLDTQELLEFYQEHEDIIKVFIASAMANYQKIRLLSISQILGYSLFLYLEKKHDIGTIESFFSQLFFNQNVENESIYNLRETLIANISGSKRLSPFLKSVYIVKCWNAYITGKVIKRYTFPANEVAPEFL